MRTQNSERDTQMKMATKDYIYCEFCKEFVDLWKYDSIEDTGHDECKWRYVTDKELKECIKDCKESGCFKEERL